MIALWAFRSRDVEIRVPQKPNPVTWAGVGQPRVEILRGWKSTSGVMGGKENESKGMMERGTRTGSHDWNKENVPDYFLARKPFCSPRASLRRDSQS